MQRDPLDALEAVLCDVMETAAFAFGERCAKEDFPDEEIGQTLQARIRFTGPAEGAVLLVAPVDLCRELTAGILASEPDEVSETQVADALSELTNVTCGQWLTTVYGSEPFFAVSVPNCERLDAEGWNRICEHRNSVGFLVDNYPVVAEVQMAGGASGDSDSRC